jgi:glycolate oxidase iron-sulfur subunit
MQTQLSDKYRDTLEGREADAILRACVHCGFCTATCPTYQLLGDELDGPRGRIYLIKQLLEGNAVTTKTQTHLDRCLTCRSCETTCPSGVRYGRLVDIGRELVEREVARTPLASAQRYVLRKLIPYPRRVAPLLRLGQLVRPLLPASIRRKVPARERNTAWPGRQQARRMLVLEGCVQSVATPQTNAAAARVLDRLGIQLIAAAGAGCCGAVSHHLSAPAEGLDFMRRNIDAWWPHIADGAEAIVVTASGCGAVVKDYGELLKHDRDYAEKARRVSELTKDISEVLRDEPLSPDMFTPLPGKVAFQSPCTLQHAQRLNGVAEAILRQAGFTLTEVADAHLCCGSAGTYSILQAELAQRLLKNKLSALENDAPDVIATANIGCQMHLATRAQRPVRHWIELLADAIK